MGLSFYSFLLFLILDTSLETTSLAKNCIFGTEALPMQKDGFLTWQASAATVEYRVEHFCKSMDTFLKTFAIASSTRPPMLEYTTMLMDLLLGVDNKVAQHVRRLVAEDNRQWMTFEKKYEGKKIWTLAKARQIELQHTLLPAHLARMQSILTTLRDVIYHESNPVASRLPPFEEWIRQLVDKEANKWEAVAKDVLKDAKSIEKEAWEGIRDDLDAIGSLQRPLPEGFNEPGDNQHLLVDWRAWVKDHPTSDFDPLRHDKTIADRLRAFAAEATASKESSARQVPEVPKNVEKAFLGNVNVVVGGLTGSAVSLGSLTEGAAAAGLRSPAPPAGLWGTTGELASTLKDYVVMGLHGGSSAISQWIQSAFGAVGLYRLFNGVLDDLVAGGNLCSDFGSPESLQQLAFTNNEALLCSSRYMDLANPMVWALALNALLTLVGPFLEPLLVAAASSVGELMGWIVSKGCCTGRKTLDVRQRINALIARRRWNHGLMFVGELLHAGFFGYMAYWYLQVEWHKSPLEAGFAPEWTHNLSFELGVQYVIFTGAVVGVTEYILKPTLDRLGFAKGSTAYIVASSMITALAAATLWAPSSLQHIPSSASGPGGRVQAFSALNTTLPCLPFSESTMVEADQRVQEILHSSSWIASARNLWEAPGHTLSNALEKMLPAPAYESKRHAKERQRDAFQAHPSLRQALEVVTTHFDVVQWSTPSLDRLLVLVNGLFLGGALGAFGCTTGTTCFGREAPQLNAAESAIAGNVMDRWAWHIEANRLRRPYPAGDRSNQYTTVRLMGYTTLGVVQFAYNVGHLVWRLKKICETSPLEPLSEDPSLRTCNPLADVAEFFLLEEKRLSQPAAARPLDSRHLRFHVWQTMCKSLVNKKSQVPEFMEEAFRTHVFGHSGARVNLENLWNEAKRDTFVPDATGKSGARVAIETLRNTFTIWTQRHYPFEKESAWRRELGDSKVLDAGSGSPLSSDPSLDTKPLPSPLSVRDEPDVQPPVLLEEQKVQEEFSLPPLEPDTPRLPLPDPTPFVSSLTLELPSTPTQPLDLPSTPVQPELPSTPTRPLELLSTPARPKVFDSGSERLTRRLIVPRSSQARRRLVYVAPPRGLPAVPAQRKERFMELHKKGRLLTLKGMTTPVNVWNVCNKRLLSLLPPESQTAWLDLMGLFQDWGWVNAQGTETELGVWLYICYMFVFPAPNRERLEMQVQFSRVVCERLNQSVHQLGLVALRKCCSRLVPDPTFLTVLSDLSRRASPTASVAPEWEAVLTWSRAWHSRARIKAHEHFANEFLASDIYGTLRTLTTQFL
jgi:hypothetical protein